MCISSHTNKKLWEPNRQKFFGSNFLEKPACCSCCSESNRGLFIHKMAEIPTIAIPIIDISALFQEDIVEKRKLAFTIGKACEEIGFFVIVGHGVDQRLASLLFITS